MQTIVGDIWQLAAKEDAIVIPTNLGWRERDGTAILGRGLARDAARRWPELAVTYGKHCQEHGASTPILIVKPSNKKWCRHLLLFPTKPLNKEQPYLSWRSPSSPELIEYHLGILANLDRRQFGLEGRILVPSLGCGNGELSESLIIPMMLRHLTDPCFTHVRYGGDQAQ